MQYIYESRDGQRTDYVKTLADMGVEKVGDMGSFLVLRKKADARRSRSILTSMRRSWTRGD